MLHGSNVFHFNEKIYNKDIDWQTQNNFKMKLKKNKDESSMIPVWNEEMWLESWVNNSPSYEESECVLSRV